MNDARRFTVAEANALLPELEGRLRRLQEAYRAAREKYVEMKQLKSVGTTGDGSLIMAHDFRQARREFEKLVEQVNALVDAANQPGCVLKHVELGLVDFPARVNGRDVLLCWRVGEPMVAYFHEPDAGYAGRRPLPEAQG